MTMDRRPITAQDLDQFRFVSDPRISPDGRRIAYVVRSIDGKEYRSHLFVDDRQFTHGHVVDALPRWSPEGETLAFVRTHTTGRGDDGTNHKDRPSGTASKDTQIWLIPADGGEAAPLTRLPPGRITQIEWAPDGRHLAFVFRPGAQEKEPPVSRHITRLRYKEEGTGFLGSERSHIWVISRRDGKTRQITRGDWDDADPAWSPDSRQLAFVSNRSRDADYRLLEIDLWVVPATGGKPHKLPTPRGPVGCPAWSPNGRSIAYLGHDRPDASWGTANIHVWTVPSKGRRKAKDLLAGFDRTCEDLVVTDTKSFHGTGQAPVWSRDGRTIMFLASDSGASHIHRVSASGGAPVSVTRGSFEVMGFTVAGRRIAAAISDSRTIGEIYLIDRSERRRISHINDALFRKLMIVTPREFNFKSFDGTKIQGWLLRPPHFDPGKKWPVILQIHGGPRALYGYGFFHEFQLLAAEGYVVLYTNPRGSQGYGEAFASAIVNDWGNLDYRDLMAGVDELVKKPWVNPRRLGVCGGSYGGYMTNWIVGRTNRFRAAITMRSVSNIFSFYGTSDFGFEDVHEFGGHAFDDPENYARQSPITFVKRIRTPLLIMHSEGDLRCPIEQAEQLYTMLKAMKRKVEFVRFPEENHDLSRVGRPDRRLERLEIILRWWKKYL
jgi:dipeptidyl aminopeptidase/acylaminoacyl peptidase